MAKRTRESDGIGLAALMEDRDAINIDAIGGTDVGAELITAAEGDSVETEESAVDDQVTMNADATLQMETLEEVIIEDPEILQSFVSESKDHLENIEEKILKLETSNDGALVNDIFRSMHTMKGTSAFFGFHTIERLSHSLESVLDDLRNEIITLSPDIIDLLLAGSDLLGKQIDQLEREAAPLDNKAGIITLSPVPGSSDISGRIKAIRSGENKSPTQESEEQPADDLITPEILESFVAESADLLDATEELILELEKKPENKKVLDGAFRCIHTLKGNAGFLGLRRFERLSLELESVLDSVRDDTRTADHRVIEIILSTIDSLRKAIVSLTGKNESAAPPAVDEDTEYKPIGEILVDMGVASTSVIDEALNQQERRLGEILVEQGKVTDQDLEIALSAQQKSQQPGAGGKKEALERKDIRVDMGKLDKLFDLMGELITAEAMVINNPELESLEIESFDRATSYLSKITREMQEITMSVRMIPLKVSSTK